MIPPCSADGSSSRSGDRLDSKGVIAALTILLGEKNAFRHIVILAKVPKVTFHGWVSPGDSLSYTARLVEARDEGGSVECTAHVGDRLVAEAEIVFVHLDQNDPELGAIDQKNFVFSTNLLSVLDVGKAGDGSGGDTNVF